MPRWVPLLVVGLGLAACGAEDDVLLRDEVEAVTSEELDAAGPSTQFQAGFAPLNAPYGGFGGGSCAARRTPVIYVPGNADDAKYWDFALSGTDSAYDTFIDRGWRPCELFGINYLSPEEMAEPVSNYHEPQKSAIIGTFILDVLAYTGAEKVDIVGHSFGVTLSLEAMRRYGLGDRVRRFVGIAGGLRGLKNCLVAGPANPLSPTCGSQNWLDSDVFGFHPNTWWSPNPRMGSFGFREDPRDFTDTKFYTIRADAHDEVHCSTLAYLPGCGDTAKFESAANVISQLDVGDGTTAIELDFDYSDWSPFAFQGGDSDGVGHLRSARVTGAIQADMLGSACLGTECCDSYLGACGL